ncbi:MAG: recombinase family protein [Alphaproteobacteria bacterium]|nr:recombinase family protein [Alphaproteobacteria bacterium]
MNIPARHCAIYTRKSTEEGLDQNFNSLDAQREACHAYIISQKAEGWTVINEHYDDGGFSGGNLERPALQKLMADIKAGKIHIIVVYKIDRLTRSLMDFAKLVEIFDQHSVTFVSVTQSFNTTTSMGRLTLNVLLSFAQFEREVAGERIRDKIAASKKKGMWMGGTVPFGYEVKDRALIINKEEAGLVKHIFEKYLELGCVRKLKRALDLTGAKVRTGNPFSMSVLFWLLQNVTYIGQVKHKGQLYVGQHGAIIARDIWGEVQRKLLAQTGAPRGEKKPLQYHLLQGVLFDEEGVIYSPTFTTKRKKRYPYYISRNVVEYRNHPKDVITRLPAHQIEDLVEQNIRQVLSSEKKLADLFLIEHDQTYNILKSIVHKANFFCATKLLKNPVQKIIVGVDSVTIHIMPENLRTLIQKELKIVMPAVGSEVYKITVPFRTRKSKRGAVVIRPPANETEEDAFNLPPHELRDIVRGIIWRGEHFAGMTMRDIAKREGHSEVFIARLIRKSFDII